MLRRSALAGTLVALALGPPALANHSSTQRVSTGPAGGNGAFFSDFEGASTDGSRVFFQTDESLMGTDTDTQQDVYERVGTTTNLVSTGPIGGNGPFGALFWDASPDGTSVVFDTKESLVSGDTDSSIDLYRRSGSTTTLLSLGSGGGNGAFDALFDAASTDGTHVFFHTRESLVTADMDTSVDLYDSTGAAVSLVLDRAHRQKRRVRRDLRWDVYGRRARLLPHRRETRQRRHRQRQGRLRARGGRDVAAVHERFCGQRRFCATFAAASTDGTIVFFDTAEKLRSGRHRFFHRHLSTFERDERCWCRSDRPGATAPSRLSSRAHPRMAHASSFHTRESMVSGDTDTSFDVYERVAAYHDALSTGPAGGNGEPRRVPPRSLRRRRDRSSSTRRRSLVSRRQRLVQGHLSSARAE